MKTIVQIYDGLELKEEWDHNPDGWCRAYEYGDLCGGCDRCIEMQVRHYGGFQICYLDVDEEELRGKKHLRIERHNGLRIQ